ncbi:hypothetical protein P9D43_27100 [Neobacillus niacini]|uniref:hypothetical protein n=1 Tax=Neobacillus niacini TaxID=86668 RepID=UPI0007ABA6F1|nr:hypothetical protein [Neobacillus niacini]MEC1525675.1 hypothetical protein [Neobacillus niacini]
MEKLNIQFEEIETHDLEQEAQTKVLHEQAESEDVPQPIRLRRTVTVAALAGFGAFIVMGILSFLLKKPLLPLMKSLYSEMLADVLPKDGEELQTIIEGLDWNHIFLAFYQQFGSIMLQSTPQGDMFTEGGEISNLFVHYQLGVGFLLIVPFAVLYITYHLSKKWLDQDKNTNRLFIFLTSLVNSFLLAVMGLFSRQTAPSAFKGADYQFSYSYVAILAFSFITSVLFLYLLILRQERKWKKGISYHVNAFSEALKVTIQMVVLTYLVLFIGAFIGVNKDAIDEDSLYFGLLFAPLFLGVLLFSPLNIISDESGVQEFLTYSLSNGVYLENERTFDGMVEVFTYVDNTLVLKIVFYLLIVYFFSICVRKGYLITKYTNKNPMNELIIFASSLAVILTMVMYLFHYDLYVSSKVFTYAHDYIEMKINVEEIPVLLHSFVIGSCCSIVGAAIYMWKFRRRQEG